MKERRRKTVKWKSRVFFRKPRSAPALRRSVSSFLFMAATINIFLAFLTIYDYYNFMEWDPTINPTAVFGFASLLSIWVIYLLNFKKTRQVMFMTSNSKKAQQVNLFTSKKN